MSQLRPKRQRFRFFVNCRTSNGIFFQKWFKKHSKAYEFVRQNFNTIDVSLHDRNFMIPEITEGDIDSAYRRYYGF